jgi:hypothetical protein
MTGQSDLAATLRLPDRLAQVVTGFIITIRYTPQAVEGGVVDHKMFFLDDYLAHLQGLVRAGFLVRPALPDVTATFAIKKPDPAEIVVEFAGSGQHANLILVLVRLLYSLHAAPRADRYALDGDEDEEEGSAEVANDAPAHQAYLDIIRDIVVTDVVTKPGAPELAGLGTKALSLDMPVPLGGLPSGEALMEAEELRLALPTPRIPDDLDEAWLTLSGALGFIPIDANPAFDPGEEEFFASADESELIVREISAEAVLLFEYLDLLSGHNLSRIRISKQS